MSLLAPPPAEKIARHFVQALGSARCDRWPYRHWLVEDVLPEAAAIGILCLPVAPPASGDCGGVRDRHNDRRCFFTPALQADFPVCAALAAAMQDARVARQFRDTLGVNVQATYLRMEYIQDLDGAWLEPHRDVPEKIFSMVIYLCTGPEANNWGTDIYDSNRRWVGRSSAAFNSAVIFVPGDNTWHGFDKRPISGVRRLMEINCVHPSWRDRDQLCFPAQPIAIPS